MSASAPPASLSPRQLTPSILARVFIVQLGGREGGQPEPGLSRALRQGRTRQVSRTLRYGTGLSRPGALCVCALERSSMLKRARPRRRRGCCRRRSPARQAPGAGTLERFRSSLEGQYLSPFWRGSPFRKLAILAAKAEDDIARKRVNATCGGSGECDMLGRAGWGQLTSRRLLTQVAKEQGLELGMVEIQARPPGRE